MYIEHIIWTAAIAIIAGYIYKKYTGRDPLWIMVLGGMLPDTDYVLQTISYITTNGICLFNHTLAHGDFHNIIMVFLIPVMLSFLFKRYLNIPKIDTILFGSIGCILHVLEDVIVYEDAYPILAPFTKTVFGIGWPHNYIPSFFGLFDPTFMAIGLCLLSAAILIRWYFDGIGWLNYIISAATYHMYDVELQLKEVKVGKNTKEIAFLGVAALIMLTVGCIFVDHTVISEIRIQEGTYNQWCTNGLPATAPILIQQKNIETSNVVISNMTNHFVRFSVHANGTHQSLSSNLTVTMDGKKVPELNYNDMHMNITDFSLNKDHVYLLTGINKYTITINNVTDADTQKIIPYNLTAEIYPKQNDYWLYV